MKKSIITVIGGDKVGIIAKTTTFLAEADINILEITQNVVDGIFTMMMIVDVEKATLSFNEISAGLKELGESIEMEIHIQKEEIFTAMHRV